MHHSHSWEEPFGWWGPMWTSPNHRSLKQMIDDRIISAEGAALVTLLLEQRSSLIVAAGPSGAGKTTLLTSFLDYLPPNTRRIYVRGCYEPFDFLSATDPQSSALLINELSPHLPIYLWGPGVRKALQAAQAGYQLLGTAHATSVEEFVYSLAGYPLRVPAAEIAELNILLLVDAWLDDRTVRREVRSLIHLAVGTESSSIAPRVVAERSGRGEPLTVDLDVAAGLFHTLGTSPVDLDSAIPARIEQIMHQRSDRDRPERSLEQFGS